MPAASPAARPSSSSLERYGLPLILLLTAVLGLIALGTRSFWLDEGTSITIAKLPWSEFLDVTKRREGNMSLYHLLLSWWMVIGDSEFAIRLLSVVFGVLSVWALHAVARRLAGPRVALLAALLLAVNPFFIRYAQEARGYILGLLLVTVATLLFVRALERRDWLAWAAYAVVAALGVYAHFFALLVPAAHALSLLWVPRERIQWPKLFGAAGMIAVLLLPFAYLLGNNTSSGVEWAAGNPVGRFFTSIHERPPLAAFCLLAGAAALIGLHLWARRRFGERLHSDEAWRWALPLCWLLVPFAVMAVVAIAVRPLFVPKYFIVCLPALTLLAAMVLVRVRARNVLLGAVGLIVVASLALDLRWYRSGQPEDWRNATAYVVDHAEPGDGVMFYPPYVRIPFALYLDRDDTREQAPPAVYPADAFRGDEIRFDYYIPITADAVRAGAERFRRIWLVSSHTFLGGGEDPGYDATVDGLEQAGFAPGPQEPFTAVDVVRWDRDGEGEGGG